MKKRQMIEFFSLSSISLKQKQQVVVKQERHAFTVALPSVKIFQSGVGTSIYLYIDVCLRIF